MEINITWTPFETVITFAVMAFTIGYFHALGRSLWETWEIYRAESKKEDRM